MRSQEGNTIFNDKVNVVSTVDFVVPSVSVKVDKEATEISLSGKKAVSLAFAPTSSVTVKVSKGFCSHHCLVGNCFSR